MPGSRSGMIQAQAPSRSPPNALASSASLAHSATLIGSIGLIRCCSSGLERLTMPLKILATFALALIACNAEPAGISADAARELGPSGKLRVAINYGNPVLASKDRVGHLHGLAIDIARELGRQSGLAVELVGYEKAAELVANVKQNAWDVAFVSVPVARSAEIAVTAPYMEVEVTYLVPVRSRFRSVSDVDNPGVRIVVQENYSTDFFLSTRLMHAVLFRAADSATALKMLKTDAAEAFASSKHRLLLIAQSNAG